MQLRLTTPNDIGRLKDLTDALEAVMRRNGVDAGLVHDVLLIAEEVVANVIHYGYKDALEHQITVDIARADGRLTLEFRDDGEPFNPLDRPPPDLDADIEDRPIGGLGVFLVQELCESVSYAHRDGHNILRVVLPAADPAP